MVTYSYAWSSKQEDYMDENLAAHSVKGLSRAGECIVVSSALGACQAVTILVQTGSWQSH